MDRCVRAQQRADRGVVRSGKLLPVTRSSRTAHRAAEREHDDLVAGPVQVFPDEQGNIAATTLRFKSTPRDGRYAAVVLVDSIVRGQSAGFTLTGCGGALPFTGSSTIPTLAIGLVMLAVGLALVRRNRTSGRSV